MPKAKAPKQRDEGAEQEELIRAWAPKLTQAALFITIALMIARALMSETVRAGFSVFPGDESPRGPGPTGSLMLDLVACLPAMLVLARRAIEAGYPLRVRVSQVFFFALAGLAALSTLWAA